MTIRCRSLFLGLLSVCAISAAFGCDAPVVSVELEGSDTPITPRNGGYVCSGEGGVGQPCAEVECRAGLECINTEVAGEICGESCVNDADCVSGRCTKAGICVDSDGLPWALCEGLPTCAGEQCTLGGTCGGDLVCVAGDTCQQPCETLADCAPGATKCKPVSLINPDGPRYCYVPDQSGTCE